MERSDINWNGVRRYGRCGEAAHADTYNTREGCVMSKKIGYIIFVVLGMLICFAPFVGMTFARTDSTTENKELAEFPDITVDDKINCNYLGELGSYFEDHFAFRQYMVSANSWLSSKLFHVSSVDNVIIGEDDWLFYSDTINDYLGKDKLSDKAISNIVYNMSVVQEKLEEEGRTFVFTIAPNKNTLYEQGMPYNYSIKYNENSNLDNLTEALENSQVNYCNLYNEFINQDEVLYFKRDSHWNNKGALLAYNSILDSAGWSHETYEDTGYEIREDYIGDLNNMVYPLTAVPENNYYYDYGITYQYMNNDIAENVEESSITVEDAKIWTVNSEGDGTILMYRDSFGNTLLPFMANEFAEGYFIKTEPYNIGMHTASYDPDVVVIEKVERKIDELAYQTPVMTGPAFVVPEEYRTVNTDTTVQSIISEVNTNYYEIYGILDTDIVDDDDELYIVFSYNGILKGYKMFSKSIQDVTDYGYSAYFPVEDAQSGEMDIMIFISKEDEYICIKEASIDISSLEIGDDTDIIIPDKSDSKEDANNITVTFAADGEEYVIETSCATVREMIENNEISVSEDDRVIPSLDAVLYDGEQISVKRVEIKEETVNIEIPYESETEYSSQYDKGTTRVTTEGKNGEKKITYRVTYVDGVKESSVQISEEITIEPVNEVITEGTREKQAPASNNSGNTGGNSGRTVVSREYVEDCGMDTGYYIITYSDGTVEYVD